MTFVNSKLGKIGEVAAGGGAPQGAESFTAEGTPFIRAGSLNPLVNGASESTLERLSDEIAKKHGLRKFPRDTVVFAKSGMSATKGHIYRLRNEAYVVNHLAAIIPSQRVVPEFLEYSLRVFSPVRLIQDAAYPSVRLSDVATMEIPLPPLPVQRRIADVLDRAEALRAKRRASLAELDELTQSIFLDMFGDPVTKGWHMTDIAGIVSTRDGSIRTGPFGSQLLHSEFIDHGIAVLGIDNAVANEFRWGERRFISETKYRQLKRYTVKPGDVLITIMGTCGRCAVVPDDIPLAINTKHLCCITLDLEKCLPVFLHAYFLQHPVAQKYLSQTAKGAIMSGLNMGLIKGMPVPLPPLFLQREFAKRVAVVERVKAAQRASLAELDELFASLQQRAFRGEL